ncbi:MAG: HRDC domain-containing protein [Planctomycetaceae bacterium]|nr:HRDC domain-containing protein [Planctomycetaceae bacterium]
MPFQLFQYALPADPDLTELNSFLLAHRVATVQREIVTTAAGPLLLFVVEYIAVDSSAGKNGKSAAASSSSTSRIDYRDVLSESEFSVFTTLREIRKQLAEADGIPVYAVFSNAQLATMIQEKCTTVAGMLKIEGVGKARTDKYAEAFLATLVTAFSKADDEQPT